MEKQGIVNQQRTPDVEDRIKGTKQASEKAAAETLDDDITKRAADKFTETLKRGK